MTSWLLASNHMVSFALPASHNDGSCYVRIAKEEKNPVFILHYLVLSLFPSFLLMKEGDKRTNAHCAISLYKTALAQGQNSS